MFRDRADAAEKLAEKLMMYQGKNPIILAVPRGAVPMAKIIAKRLGGSYDLVLVRKLSAPMYKELAIGSVDESGWTYISDLAASVGADSDYIASERQAQLDVIHQRRLQYTPLRPPIDPSGRIVIVVDDGLATGATMISALHGLRSRKPSKLICAVPVSPVETLYKIAEFADEVVCLETPAEFQSVGQFYEEFPQINDEEVIKLLS
jgi:predicted phosphoribosyltransferase